MRNDLIRRQDVLHELDGCDYELKDWQRWKLKTMVRDIPSAEKAQLSGEDATKDATSDLISRKEAIDEILSLTNCDTVKELRAYVIAYDLGSWWSGGVLSSIGKVEQLPSAEGCKCPCEYREPCDYCHYDGHLGLGCPAERRGEEE